MLEIGKTYVDGWGAERRVMGPTRVSPDWVWTLQGDWYRQSDGRKIGYVLMDKTKPDGPRRHEPMAKPSMWDLKID